MTRSSGSRSSSFSSSRSQPPFVAGAGTGQGYKDGTVSEPSSRRASEMDDVSAGTSAPGSRVASLDETEVPAAKRLPSPVAPALDFEKLAYALSAEVQAGATHAPPEPVSPKPARPHLSSILKMRSGTLEQPEPAPGGSVSPSSHSPRSSTAASAALPPPPAGASNTPNTTLFISNLQGGAIEADLARIFQLTSGFQQLRLHYGTSANPVAFADYSEQRHAGLAMQLLQGVLFGANRLRIDYARPSKQQRRGPTVPPGQQRRSGSSSSGTTSPQRAGSTEDEALAQVAEEPEQ